VLEISKEEKDGRTHTKIRLSMKDAAQDGSATDLGEERASGEAMKGRLAQSLNSAIGMGVASDPMAPNKGSNLVLKSDATNASNLIRGYALVGDDEGEPPAPEPAPVVKPMGRGRGSTLPAWMTQSDGPTGLKDDKKPEKKRRKEKKREAKEERKERKNERKRHREEHRHQRKHRSRPGDSDEEDRRRKRRRKGSDSDGSRGQSYSDSDSENDRRRHRYDKGRERRSSPELKVKDLPFGSVEEAKKLIAKLEAEKERSSR
jgi:hypothetical protein